MNQTTTTLPVNGLDTLESINSLNTIEKLFSSVLETGSIPVKTFSKMTLDFIKIFREGTESVSFADRERLSLLITVTEAQVLDQKSDSFSDLSFSMVALDQALQRRFLYGNIYISKEQPLRQLSKMIKGEEYCREEVSSLLIECLPAMRAVRTMAAEAVEGEKEVKY